MTTIASTVILAELSRGVRTTSELAEASGLSRDAVNSTIRRLNEGPHEITNVRRVGGHSDGLYVLTYDPATSGPRVCHAPQCTTRLSRSNQTPYCRLHLAEVAVIVFLESICEYLDEQMGVSEHEQLELCCVAG